MLGRNCYHFSVPFSLTYGAKLLFGMEDDLVMGPRLCHPLGTLWYLNTWHICR